MPNHDQLKFRRFLTPLIILPQVLWKEIGYNLQSDIPLSKKVRFVSQNSSKPPPTPKPTATPKPEVDSTPRPTNLDMERIYPSHRAKINLASKYIPRFRWVRLYSAEWYHVYITNPTYSEVFVNNWYKASDTCIGDICFIDEDLWYQIWVGLADYSNLDGELFKWYRADKVCNSDGSCIIKIPEMVSLDEYEWWMQHWGPGGFSNWYVISSFTVTS